MPLPPPELSAKARMAYRTTVRPLPLSNEVEHLGRRVRIVRGRLRGELGTIVKVYTAELPNPGPRDVGCRDVFCDLETSKTLVLGVTWEEYIQVPPTFTTKERKHEGV